MYVAYIDARHHSVHHFGAPGVFLLGARLHGCQVRGQRVHGEEGGACSNETVGE
jgi:hypothetical protein